MEHNLMWHNRDTPTFKILQWLLLRLRAGESFRPSSSLKSVVPEEHDCLSIKSNHVLGTPFLLSLKLFNRMIEKVFWKHTKD